MIFSSYTTKKILEKGETCTVCTNHHEIYNFVEQKK